MNAIILCGGLSTRLGDITKHIPKILLDIKGKTVLGWQLEKIKGLGIDRVVLAAGHLSDVLRREVGPEYAGVKIEYAVEPERLGTGGAIKFAWEQFADPEAPTIVFNGDVLTTIDLADMAKLLRPESQGIILGSRVNDAAAYGTLEYDEQGRLSAFREKEGKAQPGYINGGIYIFNPAMKKKFSDQAAFSIEYDVFPQAADMDVYVSDAPWVDIGVPERLEWARKFWNKGDL